MTIKKKELEKILEDILSLKNEESDIVFIKWYIEDIYEEKFNKNFEYFKDREDILEKADLELYEELNWILKRLEEMENYEKCHAVKCAIEDIKIAFNRKNYET